MPHPARAAPRRASCNGERRHVFHNRVRSNFSFSTIWGLFISASTGTCHSATGVHRPFRTSPSAPRPSCSASPLSTAFCSSLGFFTTFGRLLRLRGHLRGPRLGHGDLRRDGRSRPRPSFFTPKSATGPTSDHLDHTCLANPTRQRALGGPTPPPRPPLLALASTPSGPPGEPLKSSRRGSTTLHRSRAVKAGGLSRPS